MSTDYPLGVLTDENKIRGYSAYTTLLALVPDFDIGGVSNQVGTPGFDPAAPQKVSVSFSLSLPRTLPADCYEYEVEVTVDPNVLFWDQPAMLVHCTGSDGFEEGTVLVQQTVYRMKFKALINILKGLSDHADVILPCLSAESSDEFEFPGPVVP
jgi:hypothetical protein